MEGIVDGYALITWVNVWRKYEHGLMFGVNVSMG